LFRTTKERLLDELDDCLNYYAIPHEIIEAEDHYIIVGNDYWPKKKRRKITVDAITNDINITSLTDPSYRRTVTLESVYEKEENPDIISEERLYKQEAMLAVKHILHIADYLRKDTRPSLLR